MIKRWYYSASHWRLGDVMMANITFLSFLLFSMCHSIHVAVSTWLNYSFFYINRRIYSEGALWGKPQASTFATFLFSTQKPAGGAYSGSLGLRSAAPNSNSWLRLWRSSEVGVIYRNGTQFIGKGCLWCMFYSLCACFKFLFANDQTVKSDNENQPPK